MTKVILKRDESVDRALKRLKKKVDKEGVMKSLKQHRHYEKPSEKKRRKIKEAKRKKR